MTKKVLVKKTAGKCPKCFIAWTVISPNMGEVNYCPYCGSKKYDRISNPMNAK